jgi:predicted transposase/invertase (TIGR01784 family)
VSFDWAIKRLLRDKANFEVVEGFLSILLERQIKITNVLESESNKEHSKDKHNRVDIIVENKDGEIILIELQFLLEIDYFQRMLYGVSKAIVERMVQGEVYMEVKKVYSINIVYFDLGQGDYYAYHGKTDFKSLDDQHILKLSIAQQKIFGQLEAGDIYPEYYVLKINNFDDVARTPLDEWIYFLKYDRIKEGFSAQGLLKAQEILDYSRLSPSEKAEYDYIQSVKSHERSQYGSAIQTGKFLAEEKYADVIEENVKLKEKLAEMERLLKDKQVD